jgi:hypothetical protein
MPLSEGRRATAEAAANTKYVCIMSHYAKDDKA